MSVINTALRPGAWLGVEATPELLAKLARMHAMAEEDALDDVVIAAAQMVASDARAKAPVLSGTLRRSITVEAVGPGDVRVGSDVPYARRIEYGFDGSDSRGRTYHQAAQPYLRPAIDENRERIRRAVIDGARALMRQALGVA